MFNIRRFGPHGIADLFDEAFDLYKANFMLFLGASAIVYVPLQIAMILVIEPSLHELNSSVSGGGTPDFDRIMNALGHTAVTVTIASTVNFIAFSLLSSALVYIVSERYHNRTVTLAQGYSHTLRRILPTMGALIVGNIAVAIGTAACLLPGMYLLARYIVLIQVAMLENANSPFAILRRSYNLSDSYFWRIAGCMSLLSLIYTALIMATQGALDMIISFVPIDSLPLLPAVAEHKDIADDIAQSFAGLLVSPYLFTFITVLYYDLRIRQEGYDMAVIAEQLGIAADNAGALPSAVPAPRQKRKFWQRKQAA